MQKFRSTVNNKLLTEGLFLEVSNSPGTVLYSMQPMAQDKTQDPQYKRIIPSIWELYLAERDPTEFLFAKKYFWSYSHWNRIKACAFFASCYEEMRAELEAKIAALGIQEMLRNVADEKAGHQTLAYLANKGYLEKQPVGRVSKKAIAKEAEQAIAQERRTTEELDDLISHNPKLAKLIK